MRTLAKIIAWGVALFTVMTVPAVADWQLNMHKGVTPLSNIMYDLHMVALWVCVAIGVVVFGIMIYSMIYHRKSRGYQAATFHENTTIEIIWAIIPFFILIALAFPATRTLMAMEDTSEADITIKVVGYQWKWEYQYLDKGISFFSNLATPFDQISGKEKKDKWYLLEVDNELVLPVNKKIRFLVTSNDVLHSWWVPELGVKRDAFPGFVHESWARISHPGVYRGQCTELCGVYHGFMPVVVRAVPEQEFEQWVKEKQPKKVEAKQEQQQAEPMEWTKENAMKLGKAKYTQLCVACHKADGTGMPPVFPALKGSSIAVGTPISRHINNVLHGVNGTAMQSFAKQMTDEEIAAVVTYERNAWGNNTGDLITPQEVKKLRK